MVLQKVIQADKYHFFFILFQLMIKLAVLNAVQETSRSAFFTSRKNIRLEGYVVKWFYSPSLTSCSQLCVSKPWCTSTNFKKPSKNDNKGTCELNKHERSVMKEEGKLQSQQGVTFSLHLKGCLVTGCSAGGSCLFNETTKTFECVKLACAQSVPLGMEDGSIPDNMITASSTHPLSGKTAWGRLNCSQGSWNPNGDSVNEWFQVDFAPEVKVISRIATQGGGGSWWWVQTYYVMYKTGGEALQEYKENDQRVTFQGNTDKDGVVTNEINNPFQADTVRLNPASWNGRIAWRIELYGCDI